MKSSSEILIYLRKFTNIDLFTQGIYQIRVSVNGAMPYVHFFGQDQQQSENSNLNEVEKNYVFYESTYKDQYFYSQGFLIRYEDEEMNTKVGCVFRLQENIEKIEIIMELLFLDKKILGDLLNDKLNQIVKQQQSNMITISKATFTINNPLQYNQAYYPVEFDTTHFCLMQAQIHSLPNKINFDQGYLKKLTQDELDNQISQSIYVMLKNRDQLLRQLTKIQNDKKFPEPKFKEQIYKKDDINLETKVLNSLHELQQDVYTLWTELINLMKEHDSQFQEYLEQEYLFQAKERYTNCVISTKSEMKIVDSVAEFGKQNHEVAKLKRISIQENEWKGIQYQELLSPINTYPLIFKHNCFKKDTPQRNQNLNIHYIVLVHGYQGTSYDMRYWKSILSIRFKEKIRIISATCNDSTTNKPIEEMGSQLANEVLTYIYDDNLSNFRLSFIGHSLGGLIIRAALPHLREYSKNMHTYISLASPHCGYASSESFLVDTGLMFIQKWNKCKTLEELSQKDHKKVEQTYLTQLSKLEGLEWFNNIVVLGSFQDHYVPFNSALIQKIESSNDPKIICYNQIVENILSRCSHKIDRVDVDFIITKKKLDKLIGRAAHIEFIDNLLLAKMFIYLYDEYFH